MVLHISNFHDLSYGFLLESIYSKRFIIDGVFMYAWTGVMRMLGFSRCMNSIYIHWHDYFHGWACEWMFIPLIFQYACCGENCIKSHLIVDFEQRIPFKACWAFSFGALPRNWPTSTTKLDNGLSMNIPLLLLFF